MRESWRRTPDSHRAHRRPDDETGAAPAEDAALPQQESKPEKLTKREKANALKKVGDQALTLTRGVAGVADQESFDRAAKTYLEFRTRQGRTNAELGSFFKADGRDTERIRALIPQLEELISRSGLAHPEPPEAVETPNNEVQDTTKPSAEPSSKEASKPSTNTAPADYVRPANLPAGWREELGYDNGGKLVRYIVSEDEKMRASKPLQPGDADRLAWTLGTVSQNPPAAEVITPLRELVHEPPAGDPGDKQDFKKRTKLDQRDNKKAKDAKKAARDPAENAGKESAKAREKRVQKVADEFHKRGSADEEHASEIFDELRKDLSDEDDALLRKMIEPLGWKFNGHDAHDQTEEPVDSTDTSYLDVLPLKTPADFKREFGEPAGEINGVPYWLLPDGDVALPGGKSDDPRGMRVGKDGVVQLKGSWYTFTGDSFEPIADIDTFRFNKILKEQTIDKGKKKDSTDQPKARIDKAAPYAEILSLKSAADFTKKFGESAGKINGISYWILPDGDAAIPAGGEIPRNLRVGTNGVIEIKDSWYKFNGKGFEQVSDIEALRASIKNALDLAQKAAPNEEIIKSDKRASREPALREEDTAFPPEYREPIDLDAIYKDIPTTESPDEYGNASPDVIDVPAIGEVMPATRSLKHAHDIFSELYVENNRFLADAYHEAVQGLTQEDRLQFDEDIAHLDIPSEELNEVINEELRTNPPPAAPRRKNNQVDPVKTPTQKTTPQKGRRNRKVANEEIPESPFGPGWEREV